MSIFYRIIYIIFKWPVRWLFRIHVHGKENEPKRKEGAYIMCANHMSNFDPMVLGAALSHSQPHYMAKAELFKFKPLGWIFKAFGAFPVHRERADLGAIKTTLDLLEKDKVVCVFPQGHRNKGVPPEETHIMPGIGWMAEKSQKPIVPVMIKAKDWSPRMFRRFDVYIGKPIYPEEWADLSKDASLNMQITKKAWARLCEPNQEEVK